MAQLVKHWFEHFSENFNFPDNYVCLDLETSGLKPDKDLICTVGYSVVRNSKLVRTFYACLDWTRHPGVDQLQLKSDLNAIEEVFVSRQNTAMHHSYAVLQKEGKDPLAVLHHCLDLVEALEKQKQMLIAHNGWFFDIAFLEHSFDRWLGVPYSFDPNLIYDTGICEKACQLPDHFCPLPYPGESLRDFAGRMASVRAKGIAWSLSGHCEEKYGLFNKAGLSKDYAHHSLYESQLVHYLFEEHKKLAIGA